jgi:hypothetical protein
MEEQQTNGVAQPGASAPLPEVAAQPKPQLAGPKRIKMDEALLAMLSENTQQAISIQACRQALLVLFIRQNKLEGNWRIDTNGRDLVRDEQPEK